MIFFFFFFFQAEDGIRDKLVTGVQTCALPISGMRTQNSTLVLRLLWRERQISRADIARHTRSEEHTSELQSLAYLVCRLLLEKKNKGTGIKDQREHPDAPRLAALGRAVRHARP